MKHDVFTCVAKFCVGRVFFEQRITACQLTKTESTHYGDISQSSKPVVQIPQTCRFRNGNFEFCNAFETLLSGQEVVVFAFLGFARQHFSEAWIVVLGFADSEKQRWDLVASYGMGTHSACHQTYSTEQTPFDCWQQHRTIFVQSWCKKKFERLSWAKLFDRRVWKSVVKSSCNVILTIDNKTGQAIRTPYFSRVFARGHLNDLDLVHPVRQKKPPNSALKQAVVLLKPEALF